MNILVVEDDSGVADFLVRGLRGEGHVVSHASTGEQTLALLERGQPELVILDLLLPDIPGLDLCQQLRAAGNSLPIMIVSALGECSDRVLGLRMGADDYLPKPFDFNELLARIDALQRRSRLVNAQPELRRQLADLEFNRDSLQVSRAGQPIKLTPKELALLELMMSQPGKVFSRERILATVWGYSRDPLTNIVDVYIRRLRRKVDDNHATALIHTVRGVGYRMANVSE